MSAAVIDARFYWLPFPGAWQCVLTGADGATLGEGMAGTKPDAEAAARRNAKGEA